jgi:flagellar basal-body rod protein FlgF
VVNVDTTGAIFQGGAQVGQLEFSSFQDLTQLKKQGANNFVFGGDAMDIKHAAGEVQQGKLESSNAPTAESAVRMVTVMRQFEMLQKALNIGTDMNREALEEVAKAGQ